jgi:hypothetical protein
MTMDEAKLYRCKSKIVNPDGNIWLVWETPEGKELVVNLHAKTTDFVVGEHYDEDAITPE